MLIHLRVYYEDTDCGGVVYYANYLKYFERGRTELLRSLGISLSDYHDIGIIFAVTDVSARYLKPCRYDDLIEIDTKVSGLTGATMTFDHEIRKEGSSEVLVKGTVTVAAVGTGGRAVRMPVEIRQALKAALKAGSN